MNWFVRFLTSSLGQKYIMSLTGLFLISFLIVHLSGNLQLMADDQGESFNIYAAFMSHNMIIRVISIGLYTFIVLHAIQGILLTIQNRKAKGSKYKVGRPAGTNWPARNMALLGILIFAFLCLHMGDFWWKMRFTDDLPMVTYPGHIDPVQDIFTRVHVAFQEPWVVGVYLIGVFALALHLIHGFQSAFQSLGLNHKRYTPLIKGIGWIFSIVVCLGFALIPLYHFFNA
ncbi:MAG: succinate dehydrogenase cytochrome b subunit [Bacteroidota bacterium]|nr:succinate dehydrogenase cytochrome b subunit [Bacteroidota bacterium]